MAGPGILTGELTFDEAIDKLLPKQKEYIGIPAPFACYAGGVGSGKSVSLCISAIARGMNDPGGLSLIGRLNYPALKDTTRRTFLELFPADWLRSPRDWKESENRLVAYNGHEFLFRHLDMSDVHLRSHIRSLNLSAFYIDEATETSEDTFKMLVGRLRRKGCPQHVGRLATNPAGQDWVWRTFFKANRPNPDKFAGIVAPTTENIHLPKDYIENLFSTYVGEWEQRYIRGSFADFSGMVFKDFNYDMHVYDSSKPHRVFNDKTTPPEDWPVIVGVDIGGVDPWAFVFIAIQPYTGNLFVFDEIFISGILVKELADRYKFIMGDRPLDGLAYDYENRQAALELEQFGVSGVPAVKEIKPGIFKLAQYIHPDLGHTHPFLGISPSPRIFWASHCENSIREHSSLKWEQGRDGNYTGVPQDKDNHTTDATRYAVHTFRPEPKELPKGKSWDRPDIDLLSLMFWRDQEKADEQLAIKRAKRYFTYRR